VGTDQRYSGRLLREAEGALYMFPKIDAKRFNIHDDQKMVLDFLLQEKVLLVQGTAFNWPWPDHVHRDPAARGRPGNGHHPLWPLLSGYHQ
jgi:aspartate/methionine/tyrosine aminotransferase